MTDGTHTIEPLSRKERERERHRQEILATAERIFAEKGYHATTIEEIAKEAEFAVGTIYNLFKGKEDLYTRVIEGFVRQFMAAFEEKVLGATDPEAAIAALIDLRLRHFDEHRGFIRIALEVSPDGGLNPRRAMSPDACQMHDRYIDSVTSVFRQGIESGVFDEGDPLYFALSLEGIIHAFVMYWSRIEPTDPLPLRISKMKREFLERIKVKLDRPLTADPIA